MDITINGTKLPFRFRFKAIKAICDKTGKGLHEMGEIFSDLNTIVLIGALGTGKTEDEIIDLIDQEGTNNGLTEIAKAFNHEVSAYLPNVESPAAKP